MTLAEEEEMGERGLASQVLSLRHSSSSIYLLQPKQHHRYTSSTTKMHFEFSKRTFGVCHVVVTECSVIEFETDGEEMVLGVLHAI